MEHSYSTLLDIKSWDKEDLCSGIELRKHIAADLEEVGAFRAQEDWRALVGPLEKPFRGALGPELSFISCAIPNCLPERVEIVSYALEFGFMHDDVIDTDIANASLDEMQQDFNAGSKAGLFGGQGASGKRQIAAKIIREMMSIDPQRAMTVAKSWAEGLKHSGRRQDDTDFASLEDYIPYRAMDSGYMLWHGLVTFACAITIPTEEAEQVKALVMPASIMASLVNDLFSFEKEKHDVNVQNAIPVIMKEKSCSEEEAKEVCKQRIRAECVKYVQTVQSLHSRDDICEESRRYLWVMQFTLSGNVAWSTSCPRYNRAAEWNELQLLRARYGLQKYPARYTLRKDSSHTQDYYRPQGFNSVSGISMTSSSNNTSNNAMHDSDSSERVSVCGESAFNIFSQTLPELDHDVVLQPYRYISSLPSKGFRDQAIDSLNEWLKVPPETVCVIKNIIQVLHSASLMLDDLEDGSPLRRGKPSTHVVYGAAQTINSATYQFARATALVAQLGTAECSDIFHQEVQALYVGQSYDLFWTHNATCPTMPQYLRMVDLKTGGLFRMLTGLMLAKSPIAATVGRNELLSFTCLLGRFFQIRDDYKNLSSAEYASQKGFAEDLDEGKYSFPLLHCIQALSMEKGRTYDAMHLQALLMRRKCEGRLNSEAKIEILQIMKLTKSLEYTAAMLADLHVELVKAVTRLEAEFDKENLTLGLMLELLRV